MRNNSKKIIAVLCALLLAVFAVLPSFAAGTGAADAEIDAIFGYIMREDGADDAQSWLDGSLAAKAGTGAEWYVIALRQYRTGLDHTAYADALEAKMNAGSVRGAVSRQRCALALAACGRADSAAARAVCDETPGTQGVMSLIFGLHLLRAGVPSTVHTVAELTSALLGAQLADGGWTVMGSASDVDVTAMALQALAPGADDERVRAAVDAALGMLSAAQRENGSYMSYGAENPESAAQTAMALTALGIDPAADPRFVKNGASVIDGMMSFRLADGGFAHKRDGEANPTATVQALLALISVRRARAGLGPIYIFDTDAPAVSDTADTSPASDAAAATTSAATSSAPAVTDGASADKDQSSRLIKPAVIAAIALLAAVACLVICLGSKKSGKKKLKNCIFIIAVALALILFVALTRFSTPDDYYTPTTSDTRDTAGTVTLSIRCDVAVGRVQGDHIPADGVMLAAVTVPFHDGDTVYDILITAARQYRLQIDATGSAGMEYIAGINYLYEFDLGELSGWTYRVNGTPPSVGCGSYHPADGDTVEWIYTDGAEFNTKD